MSTQSRPDPPARWPVLALGAAALGALCSLVIASTTPDVPGSEPMTWEDVVDVTAILAFGVLGAELVRRHRADGLGRALVLLAVLESLTYLLGGVADAIAGGRPHPPSVAQVCSLLGVATFIATFVVFALAPLLLFPTGRLPSPRWRWVARAAVLGVGAAALSVLLAPGPVDEDNPAWGDNPLGVEALGDATDLLQVVGLALLATGVLGGLGAYLTRCVRYRGARRRQMGWFTVGVVTLAVGLVVDTDGKSVALEVLLALGIFGTRFVAIAWPLLGPLGGTADEEDAARARPHREEVRPSGGPTSRRRPAPGTSRGGARGVPRGSSR